MTTFWIIAGAFALVATLFVALPLLRSKAGAGVGGSSAALNISVYRDRLAELETERRAGRLAGAQYDEARGEIERQVLEDVPEAQVSAGAPMRGASRATALVAAIAVPLLAGALYLAIGDPATLSPEGMAGRNTVGPHDIDEAIAQLSKRLQENPGDGPGWAMLARTQNMVGRFVEASSSYARSVALLPEDAQLLADYADALAMANGRNLQGEPEKLIERALRANPDNPKAVALAGTIAYGKRDYPLAVKHWERLLRVAPADSEYARAVVGNIEEAKRLAAGGAARSTAKRP